jgi:hypothetical protein
MWQSGRSAPSTSFGAVNSALGIAPPTVGATPKSSAPGPTPGPGSPRNRRTSCARRGGLRPPAAGRSATTPRTTSAATTSAQAPARPLRGAVASPPRRGMGRCARRRGDPGRRPLLARQDRPDDGPDSPGPVVPAPARHPQRRGGRLHVYNDALTGPVEHHSGGRHSSNWGGTAGPLATARCCSSSPSAGSGSVKPRPCAGPTSCPAAGCTSSAQCGTSAAGGWSANRRPTPGTGP